MVILGSITSICCATIKKCFCCSKQEDKTKPNVPQTKPNSTHPIWTTDAAGYDATSTITAMEAMSPSRTGILNPPGSRPVSNLPDVTAAAAVFPPGQMKTFYPQGQFCEDVQCCHEYKGSHDDWYFSGSFTQDPRKSKEVTEL
ncbi:uncharacterized protein [Periplaneta americana]|uniref:uncharacterized protein isoform X2 n=1 Tax=Periplaneta americana TaxID=6978 RepID=UPI0037E98C69